MQKRLLINLLVGLATIVPASAVPSKTIDVCSLPGPSNAKYLDDMRERFYRNLPRGITLPEAVTIRFFLTAKGNIRDVSVFKSSGVERIDLSCVDAALCASALPPPNVVRTYLKAPPDAFLYKPEEYGEGVYFFTFAKSKKEQLTPEKPINSTGHESNYHLALIPNEVLFRYPGMFAATELESKENFSWIKADPYILECLRSPWTLQYTINDPAPSKDDLIKLRDSISNMYLSKSKP